MRVRAPNKSTAAAADRRGTRSGSSAEASPRNRGREGAHREGQPDRARAPPRVTTELNARAWRESGRETRRAAPERIKPKAEPIPQQRPAGAAQDYITKGAASQHKQATENKRRSGVNQQTAQARADTDQDKGEREEEDCKARFERRQIKRRRRRNRNKEERKAAPQNTGQAPGEWNNTEKEGGAQQSKAGAPGGVHAGEGRRQKEGKNRGRSRGASVKPNGA